MRYGTRTGAWNWSNLWRGSKDSPEGAVVIGVFSIIVALSLIVATLLFGYGIRGSGLDPRLTAYVVGSGFVLMGVLGIAVGIRQHRSCGGNLGPPRNSKTKYSKTK